MAEKFVAPVDQTVVPDDGDKSDGSPIEAVPCQFPDDSEEDYPEGGRGWLVVAGCFLQATVTLGTEDYSVRWFTLTLAQAILWRGAYSSSIIKTTSSQRLAR